METYNKELASRLLNKSSVSNEAEEMMIAKLKMEVNLEHISKMEQMFKDMRLSASM